MIKFKDFYVSDSDYEEQMELFQNEYPNAEFIQITGGHMSPERIWFKYDDKLKEQPKLSIPKKIADSIVKLAKYHQKATAVNGDVFGILDATEWLMNFMSAGRENVMNLELFDYLNQDKSGHIETCIAFMNPLTRPFVEVTDE